MHCNHSSQTCSDLPHHFLAKGWFLQKLISNCDTHNREKVHLKHFKMVSLNRGKAFTMWFSDKRRGQKASLMVDCIIVRNYSLRTFKRIAYPYYCQVTARKAHPHFLSNLDRPMAHEPNVTYTRWEQTREEPRMFPSALRVSSLLCSETSMCQTG